MRDLSRLGSENIPFSTGRILHNSWRNLPRAKVMMSDKCFFLTEFILMNSQNVLLKVFDLHSGSQYYIWTHDISPCRPWAYTTR